MTKIKAMLGLGSSLGVLGLLIWLWVGFTRILKVEGGDPWIHETAGYFWLALLPGIAMTAGSIVDMRRAWKGTPPGIADLIGSALLTPLLLVGVAVLLLAGLDWPRGWEHASVATRLNDRGRHAEALHHFEKAVEFAGEDVDNLSGMGIAYAGLSRLEEAREAFDRVIEVAPDHPLARLGRARVRRLQGDLEGAYQDLVAAARAAPPGWIETPLLDDERKAIGR